MALERLLCVHHLKCRLLLLVDLNETHITLTLHASIASYGFAPDPYLLAACLDLRLNLG
ncbi:unnamed protein product [Stenotrophomonas maltophilia]|nr:unnamed protein product [Stenotrophomonas maltophilia]